LTHQLKTHLMEKRILVCILILFGFLTESLAQNWDIDITKGINPDKPGSVYWKFTSASTYFVSAAAPVSLLLVGIGNKEAAIKEKALEIFGAVAIELVVSETLKETIKRRRPAESHPNEIFPYRKVYGRSFPSGHTSLAFATAASLSLQYKKWYVTVPAYLWASSVGYSRIYLGVHYSSDVLAGAAVGIGSAYLSNWLNKKLVLKRKNITDK
jgi:membrane-associated phospholipid phosphatase